MVQSHCFAHDSRVVFILFCNSCIAAEAFASALLCQAVVALLVISALQPRPHIDGDVHAARHSYSTGQVGAALNVNTPVQGNYSHSLAEWALTACNWFAKELPRVRAQQKSKHWGQLYVEELRWVLPSNLLASEQATKLLYRQALMTGSQPADFWHCSMAYFKAHLAAVAQVLLEHFKKATAQPLPGSLQRG